MNNSTWHPVQSDIYLVSGTANIAGSIGKPESFQIEKKAPSSRTAYTEVRDELYNSGREHVHVVAIKMKCLQCGECHVTVPTDLYL